MITSVRPPDVDEANDCIDDVLPFNCDIPPPAPASPAHENVPSVQISFCDEALQLESDAPKSEATVRPPVDEALLNLRFVVEAFTAKKLVVVLFVVEAESDVRRPVNVPVVAVTVPRLETVE